tara:strand:+ start:31109 stop:31540 length:432 start_codon:yes stop_codon:yes gene_type:complete
MGAWGHNSFENDTAGDWIWGLKTAKKSLLGKVKSPFAYPMSAIDKLLKSDLYIDAPEGEEAIAAAECLAAAQGNPPSDPPEELEKWLASLNGNRPDPEMLDRAKQALLKVRNDEQSEIRELWQESEYFKEWQASIDGLITRLS